MQRDISQILPMEITLSRELIHSLINLPSTLVAYTLMLIMKPLTRVPLRQLKHILLLSLLRVVVVTRALDTKSSSMAARVALTSMHSLILTSLLVLLHHSKQIMVLPLMHMVQFQQVVIGIEFTLLLPSHKVSPQLDSTFTAEIASAQSSILEMELMAWIFGVQNSARVR